MNTWCIARATAKTGLLIWFGLQLEKSWAPTKFHQTFAPRDKFAAVGVILIRIRSYINNPLPIAN